MIKVATLSYQHAFNYGAVFQVAALQHVITQLGANCDIIDYRCPAIDQQYDFKPVHVNLSCFNAIRANLVLAPFIRGKKKSFQHWIDSYKKTDVITSKEQLLALNEKYDKFVVGSDQVWNLKCNGYDGAFFLDFVSDDSKKVAYAASFGTYDLNPDDKSLYEKYIKRFESISVRENSGVNLVKNLTGKDSISCMDPVLLAGRNFWESKKDKSFNSKEKYIFVYHLGHGKRVAKFAKQLKKSTGLKVFFATGHLGNMVYYSIFDENVSSASPEQFLSLISGAEFVVTNSFHATVLSIVFRKQFYTISKGDEKNSYNTRIFNLLSDYDLKERIMSEFHHIALISNEKYDAVEEKIIFLAKNSLLFLCKSLGLEKVDGNNNE